MRKIIPKLRAHLRKCGDTSSDIFEPKQQVLSLELFRETIQDNHLDDFLAVEMKHQSWIAEWASIEMIPYPRDNLKIQEFKALIEDLEDNEVTPE